MADNNFVTVSNNIGALTNDFRPLFKVPLDLAASLFLKHPTSPRPQAHRLCRSLTWVQQEPQWPQVGPSSPRPLAHP